MTTLQRLRTYGLVGRYATPLRLGGIDTGEKLAAEIDRHRANPVLHPLRLRNIGPRGRAVLGEVVDAWRRHDPRAPAPLTHVLGGTGLDTLLPTRYANALAAAGLHTLEQLRASVTTQAELEALRGACAGRIGEGGCASLRRLLGWAPLPARAAGRHRESECA